jgi:hypothetical protein
MLLKSPRLLSILAAAAALTAVAGPASGHHSFAMFDNKKEVMLEGTVKEFQWKNPHAFIQLMVKQGGKDVEWSLEGGSPNIMGRNGWKRTSLATGEKVKILIHPLRDGRPGGSFLEVHKQNGEVLYYHG